MEARGCAGQRWVAFHVATRESSRALVPGDEDVLLNQLSDPGVARGRAFWLS